jgi:Na+/glutamate symporter
VEKKLLKFRLMDHRLEDTPQTLMFELRVVAKRDLGNTITSITAAVNITTIQASNKSLAMSFHLPLFPMPCLKGIMHRQTHRDNTVMTLAIHHQETNGQAKREIARGISG